MGQQSSSFQYYKKIINNLTFRLIRIDRQMVRTNFVNNRIKINKILDTKWAKSAVNTAKWINEVYGDDIKEVVWDTPSGTDCKYYLAGTPNRTTTTLGVYGSPTQPFHLTAVEYDIS